MSLLHIETSKAPYWLLLKTATGTSSSVKAPLWILMAKFGGWIPIEAIAFVHLFFFFAPLRTCGDFSKQQWYFNQELGRRVKRLLPRTSEEEGSIGRPGVRETAWVSTEEHIKCFKMFIKTQNKTKTERFSFP